MTPAHRTRRLQITIIVVLSLFAIVLIGIKGILESASFRRTVNTAIATHTEWQLDAERVRIIPWTGQITLWGLSARHPLKDNVLTVGNWTIDVDFLRLVRGRVHLSSKIHDVILRSRNQTMVESETITFNVETSVTYGNDAFPYLHDARGTIDAKSLWFEGTTLDTIAANMTFNDNVLTLKPLTVDIKGRALTGSLVANIANKTVEATVDIPTPISLPHLGKHSTTIDTGGDLSGHIAFSSKGFVPFRSVGAGHADLTHRFHASPEHANTVKAVVRWDHGHVTLGEAALQAGESVTILGGWIDLNQKKIALTAKGDRFPLEYLFENFRDKDLKPISGATDFEGTFEGWGKKFHAQVKGVTYDGGWNQLAAERIECLFEATYDRLHLTGTIFQGNRQTGNTNFSLDYGPRAKDGKRSKKITLAARIDQYDVGATLGKTLGLSGSGTGEITLEGLSTNPQGTIHANVTNGRWNGVAFDRAAAMIDVHKHQLSFHDMTLKLAQGEEQPLNAPITVDIHEGRIRVQGKPVAGLIFDLWRDAREKWAITTLAYVHPERPESLLTATGTWGPKGALNVRIQSSVDLSSFKSVAAVVRDVGGDAVADLRFSGTTADPRIDGFVELKGTTLSLRLFRLPLEGAEGVIRFQGDKVVFDRLHARVDNGSGELTGDLTHRNLSVEHVNLALIASSFPYRSADGWLRGEFDGRLQLAGTLPSPLLSGTIALLDGRYTKDFTLLETLAEKPGSTAEEEAAFARFNPRLDLGITTSGDFFIRNNIGEIGLRLNTTLNGTQRNPKFGGTINVTEGQVDYLGLNFDITKGFLEFRQQYAKTMMEVTAERDIGIYHVTLVLRGPTDNLTLDLAATSPQGPLEKRDIISLIAFGTTERERDEVQAVRQRGELTAQIITSQFTHIVERPVSRFAHLDTFRLEATDPRSQAISRVTLGKQLSDRLSIDFSTSINAETAEQTVTSEYFLTDHFLLKGIRGSHQRYDIRGAVRFRSR